MTVESVSVDVIISSFIISLESYNFEVNYKSSTVATTLISFYFVTIFVLFFLISRKSSG